MASTPSAAPAQGLVANDATAESASAPSSPWGPVMEGLDFGGSLSLCVHGLARLSWRAANPFARTLASRRGLASPVPAPPHARTHAARSSRLAARRHLSRACHLAARVMCAGRAAQVARPEPLFGCLFRTVSHDVSRDIHTLTQVRHRAGGW